MTARTLYYPISETTTIIISNNTRKHDFPWVSFVTVDDIDDRFITAAKYHKTYEEAEARMKKLASRLL